VIDRDGVVATTGQGLRRTRLSVRETWDSTIGKKVAVAISGAILVVYLVLHMVGNLNALYGAGGSGGAREDHYAEWLRTFGQPLLPRATFLWVVRALLLTALVVHVTGVVQLRRRAAKARPEHRAKRIGRSVSSRTMMLTGTLLLAFIIFHILQFTTLTIDVTPLHSGDVYANLYYAFHKWYFVVVYVAAVVAVGYHLRHALWSLTQTLGYDRPSRNRAIRTGATGISILLCVGFAVIPLAFITGVLGHP
jgi:succinate dehydrogenase / fumarate reductase cytochrome b subunit